MKIHFLAALLLLSQSAQAEEAEEAAAAFCRNLAEKVNALRSQCPVLRMEVELIRCPLNADGTRIEAQVYPTQKETIHIEPIFKDAKYKFEHHPRVSPWKGNPRGKWCFEDQVQRYSGEAVLTLVARIGTENGMGPRRLATIALRPR